MSERLENDFTAFMKSAEKIEAETIVYQKEIDVQDFVEHCVDVPRFRECCAVCPNYGKTWSCPPYDFDPIDYWNQYSRFYLYAVKTITPPEYLEKTYELEELMMTGGLITLYAIKEMDEHLLEENRKNPGSQIIGGGSCLICGSGNCARLKGEPCRFPEKMTYSIESLGGNVEETLRRYFDEKIYWGSDGHLAPYYIRIGGLLKK